jgi:hypothetical protein
MCKLKTKILAISVLIAVLWVSCIVGIQFYYNSLLETNNQKIASLTNQIATQKNEIANLTSQVKHIHDEEANITKKLGVKEISNQTTSALGYYVMYDALFIKGTVINTGNLTAYNAGLKVVAYSADGVLEINMTVPLVHGAAYYIGSSSYYGDVIDFGTDNATQAIASSLDSYIGSTDSLKLGDLYGGQTVPVNINILHEGIVTNWTVTPVWSNTP